MKRLVAVVIALLVLIVSGLLHGLASERWQTKPALTEAAARVAKVPMDIGPWRADSVEADEAAFYQAGALAHWTRSYVNVKTKERYLVILMCGRSGRMAAHTPEVCYRGAGYEMERDAQILAVSTSQGVLLGTFWSARFSKDAGAGSGLRLLWSWRAKDTWQAPAQPRWDFGGEPFLYKLYLSHDEAGPGSASTAAITDFLRHFLPELNKTLLDNPT